MKRKNPGIGRGLVLVGIPLVIVTSLVAVPSSGASVPKATTTSTTSTTQPGVNSGSTFATWVLNQVILPPTAALLPKVVKGPGGGGTYNAMSNLTTLGRTYQVDEKVCTVAKFITAHPPPNNTQFNITLSGPATTTFTPTVPHIACHTPMQTNGDGVTETFTLRTSGSHEYSALVDEAFWGDGKSQTFLSETAHVVYSSRPKNHLVPPSGTVKVTGFSSIEAPSGTYPHPKVTTVTLSSPEAKALRKVADSLSPGQTSKCMENSPYFRVSFTLPHHARPQQVYVGWICGGTISVETGATGRYSLQDPRCALVAAVVKDLPKRGSTETRKEAKACLFLTKSAK